MRRVVVPPSVLKVEVPAEVRLSGEVAHYVSRVLRQRVGDRVMLIDGAGGWGEGELVADEGDALVVLLDARGEGVQGESPLRLGALVGLPKGDRWEWVIQKCTELGVTWLQPVYTARGDVRIPAARLEKRQARWERIAREAARQCRRACAVEVRAPAKLLEVFEGLEPCGGREARLVAAVSAAGRSSGVLATLSAFEGELREVLMLVGPEGGLTEDEVAASRGVGFELVGMGPRVLRTETAAVTLCALVQAGRGDLAG